MKTLVAALLLSASIAANANADSIFTYLSDQAYGQYSDVCSYGCDPSNGFAWDTAEADVFAGSSAYNADYYWDDFVANGCTDEVTEYTEYAYSDIGNAEYYLGLPDWDGSGDQEAGYDGFYSDAGSVTGYIQSNLDYYLGGCQ